VDIKMNEQDQDKSTETSYMNDPNETTIAIVSSDNYFVKKWRQSRLNKVWRLYGKESVVLNY
jgi:hypothetical protein